MSEVKTVPVSPYWQQYFDVPIKKKPSGGYKSIFQQNQINLANLQNQINLANLEQKKSDFSDLEKDVRRNPSKWSAKKIRERLENSKYKYTPQERQYLENHANLQDALDQMPQKEMSDFANKEVNENIQANVEEEIGIEMTDWNPGKYKGDINTDGLKNPNNIWDVNNWETVNWDGSPDTDEEEAENFAKDISEL